MVEPLKALDALNEPDPRQLGWHIRDDSTGIERPKTIADHYRTIESFTLHEGVPE